MSLTERDLDLIEVALESAISACGTPFTKYDEATNLAGEYQHALNGVQKMRRTKHDPIHVAALTAVGSLSQNNIRRGTTGTVGVRRTDILALIEALNEEYPGAVDKVTSK